MPEARGRAVLKVAVLGPLYTLFDYLPPADIPIEAIMTGLRVRVPFGARFCIGWVVSQGISDLEETLLKPIDAILDDIPFFPQPTWDLLLKAHRYYHHPLGDVIQTGLPLALRKGKPTPCIEECSKILKMAEQTDAVPMLNNEQQNALDKIQAIHNIFECFLLQGITGSGKTEVYLQAIQAVRARQQSVLVLIPEIALTPQTLMRFQARFHEVIALYHSQMTDKQRTLTWAAVYHKQVNIVIGTRSALFLPIQNLGLIIIDEEHDASFKQQEGFRYSARDMAVLLARQQNIPIVLGSATPSFESLHNANQKKYTLLSLSKRAANAVLPEVQLLDIRHKKLEGGLSNALISEMDTHLKAQGQVLIFLNRRGYAPSWMCFDCGWFAGCKRCDTRLTYHLGSQRLRCHHCENQVSIPSQCQGCGSLNVKPVGTGTEKLEETLQSLFPNYVQVRIDRDTVSKKGALQDKLDQINTGEAQILIGTQLLAKGHHFPNVTLVAIVDVDGGLFSTDFRAVERMGQLITQVAGRAGRGERKGKVILQTCQPNHPLVQSMVQNHYNEFAANLLTERASCALPPFSHFALLRASHTKATLAESFLRRLKQALQALNIPEVAFLGPISAPMSKRQNQFRFQLLLQSLDRVKLHQALSQLSVIVSPESKSELGLLAKKLRWSIDVDPIEMG